MYIYTYKLYLYMITPAAPPSKGEKHQCGGSECRSFVCTAVGTSVPHAHAHYVLVVSYLLPGNC